MTAARTRHLRPENLRGLRWRGYLRESTQGQADRGAPLDRQRADIEKAVAELGLIPADPVWYERVGSGETERAPELQAALAAAGRREYDVLVVFHSSRLARNQVEAGLVKREFAKAGAILYFVSQRLISGTYQGALAEGVSEVLDAYENETRRMWVSGGQRERHRSGRWLGIVPFGLRKVMVDRPDGTRGWDGTIEPDPATAPVIRAIYDAAAAGQGSIAIAGILNATGSRTGAGRPWQTGSVDAVLTNPVYAGRLIRYRIRLTDHYYDHESEDGHADLGERYAPVVDPRLFEQVRALRLTRNRANGTARRHAYPLSGVMRCRRCGSKMTGVHGSRARYYRCSARAAYRTCDAPGIRADVAEQAFAGWLGSYRLPPDWRKEVARTRVQAIGAGERDRQSTFKARLAKLRDLYSWGHIDKDEYLRESAEVKSNMGVMAMPSSMPSIEAVAAGLEVAGRGWLKAPEALRSTIPPLMLKAIEIDDGQVAAFVVDAGLRPLLDLCVAGGGSLNPEGAQYTVRFSA